MLTGGTMQRSLEYLTCAFVGMVNLLSITGCSTASNWKRGGEISYQDRVEILDLMSRYAHYIDAGLGEAWASTFTPDGELIFPGFDVKGHDQLVAFAERRLPGQTESDRDKLRNHFVGDTLLVEVAPGRVHARSKVILAIKASPEAKDTVIVFGTYEDDIVKTPSGWRFMTRRADQTLPISPEFLPTMP
jgi:3-phenylpropionate/cinnamic acid dioxygenase small subunit